MKNVATAICLYLCKYLQCDKYTNLKANSLKEKSNANLDTTRDLFVDGLRLIETLQSPVVIVEQVPGFAKSPEGQIFFIKLGKWGYHVTNMILAAPDFGGATNRTRHYMVASVFPNYEQPQPQPRSTDSIWPVIEPFLNECRDVTHTNSVKKGFETGRIRVLTQTSTIFPTITKSQGRQSKDSIYIEHDGRILLPSENLLKQLSGIPASFNLHVVGSSIASEIIGQGIDVPLHDAVMKSVLDHLNQNTSGKPIVVTQPQMVNHTSSISPPIIEKETNQLKLI